MDGIGATISIVIYKNRVAHRNLYIHGKVITREKPRYLEEVAVVHALRTLHDWLAASPIQQKDLDSMTIHAGDYKAIHLLERWFGTGFLGFETIAASPLIDDIYRLETWLSHDLTLQPFALPGDVEGPTDMPLVYQDVLRVAEEFRVLALPTLGEGWVDTLPRVPLSKQELKVLVRQQYEADELLVLRELAVLGSESARIITSLELTREIVQVTMTLLRHRRDAQVTLASVLGGTRFKHAIHGVLVPTRCPHSRYGAVCGREDSFEHLLDCYNLRSQLRKGVEAIDFLVKLAKTVISATPGRSVPLYVL